MREAYENSYKLLMGETTYEELGKDGSFFLPENHEDPLVTLKYFQEIEDYEKCIKIRDIIKGEEVSKIAWDLLKSWGVKGEIININQNKNK